MMVVLLCVKVGWKVLFGLGVMLWMLLRWLVLRLRCVMKMVMLGGVFVVVVGRVIVSNRVWVRWWMEKFMVGLGGWLVGCECCIV